MEDRYRCEACKHEWTDDGICFPTECPSCGWHIMEIVDLDEDNQS